MKVTAGVVSWNTADHLPGCLRSLLAQDADDLEIVVVDNASRDGSADVARSFSDVRVVANDSNRGYAGAANQVVELARRNGSAAVLLANPDVRLQRSYVAQACGALLAAPRRAAVQGKLWRLEPGVDVDAVTDAPLRIDTTGHLAFATRLFRNRGEGQLDRGQHDVAGEVFGVSGALALYALEALDDVAVEGAVFDDDLFAFFEDVDLDWRLRLRGWDAWYEPSARALHERGGAGVRRSAIVEELNFVNRFLVIAKNDDTAALRRALPGVSATSLLKGLELAVTVPPAFVRAVPRLRRLLPRALRTRRVVQAAATVDAAAVAARWFEPFDYVAWVRTWWARVGPGARDQAG